MLDLHIAGHPLFKAEADPHQTLSQGVRDRVRISDWQTFIVGLVVLGGSFYGLFTTTATTDIKVICGGFIGSVVTFFLSRGSATTAAAGVISAQTEAASSR